MKRRNSDRLPLYLLAWSLAVAALAGKACTPFSCRLFLDYRIDFQEAASGRLKAEVFFEGSLPERLLGQRFMNLGEVRGIRPDATTLVLETEEVEGAVLVHLSEPDLVGISYSLRPGLLWENPAVGQDFGRRFGYSGPDFGGFSGLNLFLVPEDQSCLREARVRFSNLPEGRRLITTLGSDDGPWRVLGSGSEVTESLLGSLVAFGDFESFAWEVAGSRFECLFERGVSDRRQALALIRDSVDLLTRELQVPMRHTFFFLPLLPDGSRIEIRASGRGQMHSVRHWTPTLWKRVFYELVSAYIRFQPLGFRYRRQDLWFSEGAARFLALRLLDRAGRIDEDEELKDHYIRYFEDPRITFEDLTAVEPVVTFNPARVKALLATYFLDAGLRASGADLFALLREIRKKGIVDLETNLEAFPSFDKQAFLRDFLDVPNRFFDPGRLPDPIPELSPLDTAAVRVTRHDSLQTLPPLGSAPWRIIFSSNNRGRVENCGCVANQDGGLSRRAEAVRRLRRGARNTLLLELGQFLPEDKNAPYLSAVTQGEVGISIRALDMMDYDGAIPGYTDIRYGWEFLESVTQGARFPLISSNIRPPPGRFASPLSYLEANFGGRRTAIVGVAERTPPYAYPHFYEDAIHELEIEDVVAAARREVAELGAGYDLVAVAGSVSPRTAREILRQIESVDLVISLDRHYIAREAIPDTGDEYTTLELFRADESGGFEGRPIIYASTEATGISALDFRIDSQNRVADVQLHDIRLTDKVSEDARVRALLDGFYRSLAQQPDSGVEPLFRSDPALRWGSYLGAASCVDCHPDEHRHWNATPHSRAYKTLITANRHLYPKCVVCHVTGYGYTPGFENASDELKYGGVQCEVCHGPGESHLEQPSADNIRGKVSGTLCRNCHTPEHSARFLIADRLPRVIHKPNGGQR